MGNRIGIVGDVHWCTNSSIVRSRGQKYSTRLENLIQSINWAEQLFQDENCDTIIYLGDFFDRSDLNAEEISALQELKFIDRFHIFLLGNHEIYNNIFTSLSALQSHDKFWLINKPTSLPVAHGSRHIYLLPYIKNEYRSLKEYFPNIDKESIVFSHNDIKGFQYGMYKSDVGIDIEDIKSNCKFFFNGHLHNTSKITDNAFNVGNLTGQNFSENAQLYPHGVVIYDTDTEEMIYKENPYAMNFYSLHDILYLDDIKNNAVITISCDKDRYEQVKDKIKNCSKILESRIITVSKETKIICETTGPVNYYDMFKNFVISQDNSDLCKQELGVIFK